MIGCLTVGMAGSEDSFPALATPSTTWVDPAF